MVFNTAQMVGGTDVPSPDSKRWALVKKSQKKGIQLGDEAPFYELRFVPQSILILRSRSRPWWCL